MSKTLPIILAYVAIDAQNYAARPILPCWSWG